MLRLKNTLLTTVLFYDVVLASQGVEALEWNYRLNSDSLYAAFYHMAYNSYAGLTVSVRREGEWTQVETVPDVGPIAPKELALRLPVERNGYGEMEVRLEWFPDNFMIDYIGFEPEPADDEIRVSALQPHSIRDYRGEPVDSIGRLIGKFDQDYLVTGPGESYHFEYRVPSREDSVTTLFIRSRGYYTEWLRGDWISRRSTGYRFNLFDVEGTIGALRESWKENRPLLEEKFLRTRIPLKEGL